MARRPCLSMYPHFAPIRTGARSPLKGIVSVHSKLWIGLPSVLIQAAPCDLDSAASSPMVQDVSKSGRHKEKQTHSKGASLAMYIEKIGLAVKSHMLRSHMAEGTPLDRDPNRNPFYRTAVRKHSCSRCRGCKGIGSMTSGLISRSLLVSASEDLFQAVFVLLGRILDESGVVFKRSLKSRVA